MAELSAKTATQTHIQKRNMRGDARHYKLSDPIRDWYGNHHEYVIVSAIDNEFGVETYIFPADADGEIIDYGELDGSYKGGMDHAEALRGAGYDVTP